MKRDWLLLLCLISCFGAFAAGQTPVTIKHLSLPVERTSAEQQSSQGRQIPPAGTSATGNSPLYDQVQTQVLQGAFQSSQDIDVIQLPPLDVLFESARNMPYVEYHKLRRQEAESVKKTVKREWLRYINVNANYQYGNMTQSFQNEMTNADPLMPTQYSFARNQQHWWSLGATLSVPFDVLFDRQNRIRRQTIIAQQADFEGNTWHEEQKLKIIEAYTNAGMYLQLIRIKTEAYVLATQQYNMSQADFINGRMDIVELSRQKGIQNVAVTEYEQTKAQLYQVILKLESLSNYKILNQ